MDETRLTITGNLVEAAELRYTPSGVAVARFRVASTPRYKGTDGQWADGDTVFMTCNAWRQVAENVAETFDKKGLRVIVQGRLRQRTWANGDGEKRVALEIEVDDAGPSLRMATAKVTKAERVSAAQDNFVPSADPEEVPF